MGYQQRLAPVWERLKTTSSAQASYSFPWGWVPAAGLGTVRGILKNKNVVGNYTSQMCVQVAATRTDNPGSITLLGSAQGSGETNTGDTSVSGTVAENFWCRFGIGYINSSGTALGAADTSLEIHYRTTGLLVGSKTVSLFATVSNAAFTEVTDWIPAEWAAKARAALICRSLTGNFGYKLCYRLATTSTGSPGAWTALDGSARVEGEVCPADYTLSITSYAFIQFGIQYYLTDTTPGGAMITTALAIL